ncbi:hypothetical protein [Methylobacterium sp. ARG-1]|uniref:hypothetical protein n=1 Tax=Methylobacterium sp. ARG-1 TaxID=1692501 RepID=UPI0006804770|nr:hypothetical protein [Methylobacterium sp. ARG-1]KNY24541.1 hypothetical protein AKJ13_00820 [Methylobacterium sp. ARG-1]
MVFGFDADQRGGALKHITNELRGRHGLRVYVVGRPSGRTVTAFHPPADAAFRRPTDAVADPTPDTT